MTCNTLLTKDFYAVFGFAEGLFLVDQWARERFSKHKLSFSLPCFGDVPLGVHLFMHHILVVLKVAAETFSLQSCPYCRYESDDCHLQGTTCKDLPTY
jgi:hypothetical protein